MPTWAASPPVTDRGDYRKERVMPRRPAATKTAPAKAGTVTQLPAKKGAAPRRGAKKTPAKAAGSAAVADAVATITRGKKPAPAAGEPVALLAFEVPVGQILESEVNPRSELAVDDEFVASIRNRGILEPLVVEPADADGNYPLVFGHRRLAGAQIAGLLTAPVVVRPDLVGVAGEEARLIENLHRSDLTPLDEARAFHRLIEVHKYNQARVADAVGRNQGHVSKRLSLLKLVDDAADLLVAGDLVLEDAVDLSKLPAAAQDGVVAQVKRGTSPQTAVSLARRRVDDLAERGRLIRDLKSQLGAPERVHDLAAGDAPAGWAQVEDFRRAAVGGVVNAHADCPGRAVGIRTELRSWESTPERRWLDEYCATPEVHGDAAQPVDPDDPSAGVAVDLSEDAGPVKAPRMSKEERAAQKAAAERRARLEQLVARRRAFVVELLATGKLDRQATADYLVAGVVVGALSWGEVGGQPDEVVALRGRTFEELLVEVEAGAVVADNGLRWALAARFAEAEVDARSLIDPIGGSEPAGWAVMAGLYLSYLSGAGYELDELEAAAVAAAPRLRDVLVDEEKVAGPPPAEEAPAGADVPVDGAPAVDGPDPAPETAAVG